MITTITYFLTMYEMLFFILFILKIVCNWRLFEKAGRPGWAAIVPFYNSWIMAEIGTGNGWMIFFFFVPIANFFFFFYLRYRFFRYYCNDGFAVFCIFFAIIGRPILAFSKRYPLDSGVREAA